MRRSIFGWMAASALLALGACGREEVKSDVVLTSPPTDAAIEETLGSAVAETVRADANSQPRDPLEKDMGPVSYTTEPLEVPAN